MLQSEPGGGPVVRGTDVRGPGGGGLVRLHRGRRGEAVPLGAYENKKYFWEKGEIVAGTTGPTLIIPPFIINGENAADKRHWGYVAEKEWGVPYT